MVEQAVVETPVVTTPVTETPVVNTVVPEVDLLTKVSQFKPVQDKTIVNPPDQPEFAEIKDPVAKKAAAEAVERMRRGMQSDYTKKLEDANKLVEQTKNWTPERIQRELLENPQFLQAAQIVAGNQTNSNDRPLTQEEYSTLTQPEKDRLNLVPQLQNKINQLEKNNASQAIWSEINQTDTSLRTKYADYDSNKINQAFENLSRMNAAQVREHIYKAQLHDEHVKAAYEMGKMDRNNLNQEKLNVMTPSGSNVISSDGVPTKNKGESDQSFFVRIAQNRLAQQRKR